MGPHLDPTEQLIKVKLNVSCQLGQLVALISLPIFLPVRPAGRCESWKLKIEQFQNIRTTLRHSIGTFDIIQHISLELVDKFWRETCYCWFFLDCWNFLGFVLKNNNFISCRFVFLFLFHLATFWGHFVPSYVLITLMSNCSVIETKI